MKTIIRVSILIFIIYGCDSTEKNESLGQGQLLDLFANSPTSLFDQTTEGISKIEKAELIEKGESEYWIISYKSDEKIVITCKFPSSEITLFLLKRENISPVLVSYTLNEQASSIKLWSANDEEKIEVINILPKIYAQDFFSEKNSFDKLKDFDNDVYYSLNTESLNIDANLNTWMEPVFENKPVEYSIALKWNGEDFNVEKTPVMIEKIYAADFNKISCDFPSELIIHSPKEEGSYEMGVQDTRFFPVGISDKGVFAYFNFNGELDPCECVHADLLFYDVKQSSIVKTISFTTDLEDGPMDGWEEFTDPKKIWILENEKFCSALEEQNITAIEYDVIKDEELTTIFHLSSTPSDEEAVTETINYTIYDEDSEIIAKSKPYAQIISAELVAMLRYKIGDEYYFVKVVTTTHPGFEGSLLRQYDIY